MHFPENMANRDHQSERMSTESSIEKYKDLLTPEPEEEEESSPSRQMSEVESVDISEEEKKLEEMEE